MSAPIPAVLTVVKGGNQNYINVHPTRGEELARFLRSRGVTCTPPQPCSDENDSIEVARAVDVNYVQKLLNDWKPAGVDTRTTRSNEC